MSRTPLRLSSAIASVATLACMMGVAGPASASGGTPTTPIPAGINCGTSPLVLSRTAPDIAVNYAGDAGCVGVRVTATTVRLAWVVLSPGWTYVVKRNGGGTNDRVELQFTHTATGTKLTFRYERGRTVIG
jgi:hypothetical protein